MRFLVPYALIIQFLAAMSIDVSGQRNKDQYPTQYIEGNIGGAGSQQNFSINCHFDGNFNAGVEGKRVMMHAGLGVRFTSYVGTNRYFVSVAEMISNPGSISKPNIPDPDPTKKDSVFVSGVQMQSLNLTFNFGFLIKNWLRVGLNGDMIGGTFGQSCSGVYINGAHAEAVTVTPEHYNCFWIGKGDQSGMLLIEFYVIVPVAERMNIKLAAQHIDMEYRTDKEVQTYPRSNDRFRASPTMVSVGLAYSFGKYP